MSCVPWDFRRRRPRGPCVSGLDALPPPADIDYAAAALAAAHAACEAAFPDTLHKA